MKETDDTAEFDADDEALSWEGDDDVVRDSDEDEVEEPVAPRRGIFDVVREMTGRERAIAALFSIAALASCVGWGFVVAGSQVHIPDLFTTVMYQFGQFLAILAPALAVFTVVQIARGRARTVWLAVMAIVTLPWPLIVGVLA